MVLGWHSFNQLKKRDLPVPLMRMAGASLMEVQARYFYPQRLETDNLIMIYGDSVIDPHADAEAMSRHVAELEEMTGLRHRSKIWWVRGSLLGFEGLALYGLALGSSKSPAASLDRHELAHAVFHQYTDPDADPPTLLMEGWAESQSVDGKTLAERALASRRFFSEWGLALGKMSESERSEFLGTLVDAEGCQNLFAKYSTEGGIGSYVRELTGPFWYHHATGPVYSVGGAFTAFLLRRYSTQQFVELYLKCRPATFAKRFPAHLRRRVGGA
jgi:hypothetical protein